MIGQAFEKEEALFSEFGKTRIIAIIDDLLAEESPQPFYEVQIG